jgi:thiol:disulfide interchange protein DsbD
MLGTMAIGMALPYVILTAKPAWMKYLPRPGVWMERLKQLMGFLMLAIVIALLWLIGLGRDANAVVTACAFLLVLGLASWVRGAWPRSAVSWIVALVLAVGGWMYLIQGRLDAHATTSGLSQTRDGLTWEPFTPQRVEEAIAWRQPVFIDFTADWCVNCKYNESVVLESDAVRAVFKEKNFLLLKADWTNADPVITEWLHKFNRVAVPVYVIYNGRSAEPDVLPEILTRKLVLERLKAVDG